MPKRKNQTRAQREKLTFGYECQHADQMNLFGVADIQTSTCQLPIGKHSFIDAFYKKEVTQSECWAYIAINEDANWETGQSKSLSYADIEKRTGLSKSGVLKAVNGLIEKGWMTKSIRNQMDKHDQNTTNTYMLVGYQCHVHEVPLDKDGRPKHCAVANKEGSVFELVEDGRLHWKDALYWVISKVESDWTTSVVEMSIAEAKKLMHMTAATICDIRKRLKKIGLLEQLSKPFRKFTAILSPKPYPKRRRRRAAKQKKAMAVIDGFLHSYNFKWRIHHETAQIQAKVEGTPNQWRHANVSELAKKNKHILRDFAPLLQLRLGVDYCAYYAV